jgi:hypothetical protein
MCPLSTQQKYEKSEIEYERASYILDNHLQTAHHQFPAYFFSHVHVAAHERGESMNFTGSNSMEVDIKSNGRGLSGHTQKEIKRQNHAKNAIRKSRNAPLSRSGPI